MTEDSPLPFSFPAMDHKKITAAFDGGRIASDAGVKFVKETAMKWMRLKTVAQITAISILAFAGLCL